MPIRPRPPYGKRQPPPAYSARWFATELGNLQRALPPTGPRTVTIATDRPTPSDNVIYYDATAGAITVTLPPPDQVQDWLVSVKKIDSSGNAVTLVGTIDGVTNPTLSAQYDAKTLHSNGVQYYLLASV